MKWSGRLLLLYCDSAYHQLYLKMNRSINILLLLFIFSACKQQDKEVVTINRDFQLPNIVQDPTKDTIEFISTDFLNDSRFRFCGKYKFTENLHFNNRCKLDTTYGKDFSCEYSNQIENDSLSSDGFQIYADYKTTLYRKDEDMRKGEYYFPVYIVNETSRTKVFVGKDSYALGLQEAVDTSTFGQWRPIECRGFDFCGNGYFGLKVHPGEFVVFIAPKYAGETKGLMRIRLQVGESVYLSKSFIGSYNPKQFIIKKDSWPYERLKIDKASAIQWLFYGADPKGYDSEK